MIGSIFISYSWEDKDFARPLETRLSENMYNTWIDIKRLKKKWFLEDIENGISEMDNFVCCISKNYLNSEICIKELKCASILKKNIVPLLLEKLEWPPKGLIMVLLDIIYIPFYEDEIKLGHSNWDHLLERLESSDTLPISIKSNLIDQINNKKDDYLSDGASLQEAFLKPSTQKSNCKNKSELKNHSSDPFKWKSLIENPKYIIEAKSSPSAYYCKGDGFDYKFEWIHWFSIFDEYLIATDNKKIHYFKLDDLKYVQTKEIGGYNSDFKGICRLNDGNLCLVDSNDSSINIFEKKNFAKISSKCLDDKKKRWLYGCCEYESNILVVDRENHSIIYLDKNLTVKNEIEVTLPKEFKQVASLRDIKIYKNNIYLTDNDHGNKCIHVFDLQLGYKTSFGMGLLFNPYEILFFKNEFLFVIDRRNKDHPYIHIFDMGYKLVESYKLENCQEATNAIVLNDDTLIVASLNEVEVKNIRLGDGICPQHYYEKYKFGNAMRSRIDLYQIKL